MDTLVECRRLMGCIVVFTKCNRGFLLSLDEFLDTVDPELQEAIGAKLEDCDDEPFFRFPLPDDYWVEVGH